MSTVYALIDLPAWYKYLALGVCVVLARMIYRERHNPSRVIRVAAGKVIQFWRIGPEILRGYVSDFGWVPFIAVAGYQSFQRYPRWRARGFKVAMALGAWVAFTTETMQMFNNAYLKEGEYGPRGDIIDYVIFFVVYVFLVALNEGEPRASVQATGSPQVVTKRPKPPKPRSANPERRAQRKQNARRRKRRKKK
jgi:hypothetical protein